MRLGRASRAGGQRRRVVSGSAAAGDASVRFSQPTATLSGGEAARAALAAILLSRVDVLLLDEPTNNLDFAGLDLLESVRRRLRRGRPGGVARPVVPRPCGRPDRRARRATPTAPASSPADGRPTSPPATWPGPSSTRRTSRYVAERDRLRRASAHPAAVERAGRARGPRRRTSPTRTSGRRRIASSEKQAVKVKATERKLAQPRGGRQALGGLAPAVEPGRRPPAAATWWPASTAPSSNGAPTPGRGSGSGPIDLEIAWQDRVAVLGPNGSGKTTLLRALLGELPLAAGRRWVGPGVHIGEMDQSPRPLRRRRAGAGHLPGVDRAWA